MIVTSYEIAIRDAKPLQKFNYKYMVMDEGHRLKNFNCKLIRSLREFDTANKLSALGGAKAGGLRGRVLDVCTGLGYTCIGAARTPFVDEVVTIELDPLMVEMQATNS